jgi:hypothetical protein
MNPRLKVAAGCLAAALLLLPLLVSPRGGAQTRDVALTRQAWTLDEAVAALALQPRDARGALTRSSRTSAASS